MLEKLNSQQAQHRENSAEKSNSVGKGVKVEAISVAAGKQSVWVHGASLILSEVSPSLEMFLAYFISGCSCFRLNYLGRSSCVGKSVP